MDEAAVLALHARVVSQEIVAQSVSLIAQYGIFVLPAAFAVLCFAHPSDLRTKRAVLLAGVLSFILAFLLSFGIGLVLDRPRPFVALGIPPLFPYPADSSFPSDHTLLGIALVGPLVWRWPRVGIWLAAWTLLVGLARVAAAVHYPSDVIGSALLAALPTALAVRVNSEITRRARFG